MQWNSVMVPCKEWWKSWFSSLEAFLLGALLLSTLLGMVLPSAGPARDVFWVFMVPVMLWCLVRRRGYQLLWQCKELHWVFLIFLLYVVSVAWSAPSDEHEKVKTITSSLQSFLFVSSLFFAFRADTSQKIRFAKSLIVVCAVGSLVVLIGYYGKNAFSVRLFSDASAFLGYPTYSGPVLLGCWMTAALLMEKARAPKRREWLFGGFLFIGAFIFLSQTRTAILSGFFLLLLWGGYYWGLRRSILTVSALAFLVVLLVLSTHALDHVWTRRLSLGLGGRLFIWEQDLLAFMEAPWFGQGAATIFEDTVYGKAVALQLRHVLYHPHGLLFSMLFYLGGAGLLLWLLHLGTLVRRLLSCAGSLKWFGLFGLLYLLLVTATDVHGFIDNVGVVWWIWWVPVMALLSFSAADVAAESRGSSTRTFEGKINGGG